MQNFKQKLQQKFFPQQIHLQKLIELPTLAFEERISQEIEENPLLEIEKNMNEETNSSIDDDIYELDKEDFLYDDEIQEYKTEVHVNKRSNNILPKLIKNNNVYEHLRSQLCHLKLTDEEFIVADFILGNIDEEGYLRREYHELINDIAFVIEQRVDLYKIERLVEIVQTLEPSGIGARNLRECLLIQLEHKPSSPTILAAKLIINDNFDLLCKKQYKKIKERLKLNHNELHSAINEIKCLNPKPGKMYDEVSTFDTIQIVPDFLLRIEENLLELFLNRRNTRELCITPYYIKMLRFFQENSFTNKKNIVFIKKKLEKAKWFIDAIKQRKKTLLFTMKAILNFQKEYFFSGEKQKIRPMTLKNIAEYLNMEISTVSRVVNRKYIETPFGTLLLKDLFSEKIFHSYGKEVSNIEVKYILSNLIDKEDRKSPFTDEKISLILKKKGYNVARRTIAKYREQLHIPIARLRKTLLGDYCSFPSPSINR
ncbi:RNA polymerase factor sigma-54 [Candidatus Uzinura diaspidicola str. ASNER]|uniref:RNA polymerase factor sigma-54 n=1 Tax=Candidatus Uzinura diaspidicola str. ASNER TaxID=1133592 RepID=L7VFY7_9FLAO|nr:RNA polymerase factor sigma-54 [Candidatus Uzinura diaspidicola str. ASNER]